ncbi:sulfatase-like hydrolase/transferase [bacterium]|nr:sulfatase-like hydrolase/transferase [bacterium]
MKALKEEGIADDTIVVYTSDHGDFVGRHGMVEKCAIGHNVYEETLRVPLVVSYPPIVKQGQRCDQLSEMFDLYPTLLDLARINYPQSRFPMDATSLVGNLAGTATTDHKYIVSENWSQAGVITDRYKLGIWLDPTAYAAGRDFRSFGDMLFDRQNDPDEIHNVIDKSEYTKVQKQLRDYFDDFTSKVAATGKNEITKRFKR